MTVFQLIETRRINDNALVVAASGNLENNWAENITENFQTATKARIKGKLAITTERDRPNGI